jgi:hypothetical protein
MYVRGSAQSIPSPKTKQMVVFFPTVTRASRSSGSTQPPHSGDVGAPVGDPVSASWARTNRSPNQRGRILETKRIIEVLCGLIISQAMQYRKDCNSKDDKNRCQSQDEGMRGVIVAAQTRYSQNPKCLFSSRAPNAQKSKVCPPTRLAPRMESGTYFTLAYSILSVLIFILILKTSFEMFAGET